MPNPTDPAEPGPATEQLVVRRDGAAGWWVAAIVAVIAVVGLALIFSTQNRDADLQAARAQGAAQASLDAAATGAQQAAARASQAAQSAVDSSARATQRAAETAQTAANHSAADQSVPPAQAATEAGRDASDVAAAPPQ